MWSWMVLLLCWWLRMHMACRFLVGGAERVIAA